LLLLNRYSMLPAKMKLFLQRWLINTLAVLVAASVVRGIDYGKPMDLFIAALVLGILNALLRPLLMILSLPLLIFTLGLFTLVINALLLMLAGELVPNFDVAGFGSAFFGALIISIVSIVLNILTGTGKSRISVEKRKNPPPRDDGDGPIIDV
jgi:putative membrane protein